MTCRSRQDEEFHAPFSSTEPLLAFIGPLSSALLAVDGPAGRDPVRDHRRAGGRPLVASRFIDRATSGGAPHDLMVLALLTMGLALLGQGLAVAETYVAENVSWAATNALRADLVAHVLRLDATFHTAHTPGELIERVDGDVATLARFFSRFV